MKLKSQQDIVVRLDLLAEFGLTKRIGVRFVEGSRRDGLDSTFKYFAEVVGDTPDSRPDKKNTRWR